MVCAISVTSTSAWRSALVANSPPKPEPMTTTRCRWLAGALWFVIELTSPWSSVRAGGALDYPFSALLRHNASRGRLLPRASMASLTLRRPPVSGPSTSGRRRLAGGGTGHDGRVSTHFDLAVIGTGSGNSIVDERFADKRVAVLEKGTFGGTCLNVGCIPTKMFVYPADVAHSAAHGDPLGVETRFDRARWREIRDRIFRRIDPIRDAGRHWRADAERERHVFEAHARFVDAARSTPARARRSRPTTW